MSEKLLIKSYVAGAAIAARRFLKVGAADHAAIQATGSAAAILGVSESLAVASGQLVDCIKAGMAEVELGDAVTRGQYLTADADGKAIPAVIVAGTPLYVGGKAEVSGAAGDIIAIQVLPIVIANDTGIIEATVTVTTAQLLALNAAPKELIAAQGAGKVIVLEGAQRLWLDYATTAYDGVAGGEDLVFKYENASGATIATVETTGFLDQGADEHRVVYPASAAAIEQLANKAVVLHLLSGEIATGDSPLKVRVRYRVVDLEFA